MTVCLLCQSPVPTDFFEDFCCHGCRLVYQILSERQVKESFAEHPLFQEAKRSGLIAAVPQVQVASSEVSPETQRWSVEFANLWCPACAEAIEYILKSQPGVRECCVDYATDLGFIDFDPRCVAKVELQQILARVGYELIALDEESSSSNSSLKWRFGVAVFSALNVMMFAYPLYAIDYHQGVNEYGTLLAWLTVLTSLPAVFYSAAPIFKRFLLSLKMATFGMETLVAIGIATALLASLQELARGGIRVYADSMSVIIVFVLLGKLIESQAKFSFKGTLRRLVKTLPKKVRQKMADGSYRFVLAKEVKVGDVLVAVAGEVIAFDGKVTQGEGAVNESLLTGESQPIFKKMADSLVGGSLLEAGQVTYEATAPFQRSTLAQIVELVSSALQGKKPPPTLVDVVVRWFVPFVLILAIFSALGVYLSSDSYNDALQRLLAVLLISCPCAIGIAAPIAEASVLQRLSEKGAVVRNRQALQWLGREQAFIFDKTGTLTEGTFTVLSGLESLNSEELGLLKGLASHSNHPIPRAIAEVISKPPSLLEAIQEKAGLGLTGIHATLCYRLGSARLLGLPLGSEEQTITYFARQDQVLAKIILGDRLRADAQKLPELFQDLPLLLLSGDVKGPTASVAKQCGIGEWQAGCLPVEKEEIVKQWKEKFGVVAMIGDGINDAPALSAATLSFSMPKAADLTAQASDILLTQDDLTVIPELRSIGRRGRRIAKQNLFWAFFYNVVGIGLALNGELTPIFASFAMIASSLMVLANAKRV